MGSAVSKVFGNSSNKGAASTQNTASNATKTKDIEEQAINAGGTDDLHGNELRSDKNQKWLKQLFTYIVGGAMLFTSLACIVAGPDLMTLWEDNPPPDESSEALKIAYWSFLGGFTFFFILFALWGKWGELRGYHRKCHRILFIGLVVLAILFKKPLFGEDPIMFSFVPFCLMALAEFTCLTIVLIAEALRQVFLSYIPWLLSKVGKAVSGLGTAIGNAVAAFGTA